MDIGEAGLKASLLLDGEDRLLEANRDAEVFLEKPFEEVRKAGLAEANHSLYVALKDLIAKTKRGRGVEDYALPYKLGKHLMRVNVSITPYPLDALGTTGSMITISTGEARGVVEKPEAKKEIITTPEKPKERGNLWEFLHPLAEPAFLLDMEANFAYINPVMSSLMGYSPEDMVGRPLSFFMHKEEAKLSLASLVEAACSAPWRGEIEFGRSDGGTVNIIVTVDLANKKAKGKPIKSDKLLGIGRDFTVEARIRKEREEELRRVWSLMEGVGVAVACFTPDLRVTLLSDSACQLLRTTRDRAIGTLLPELFQGEATKEIADLVDLALKGEEVKGAEIQLGQAKDRQRVFNVDVKLGFKTEGKPREYMVLMREATAELSEKEKARSGLLAVQQKSELLEMAVRSQNLEWFLGDCLALLERETACSASTVFLLNEREALLKSSRGLDHGDRAVLKALRLKPGYVKVCDFTRLKLEIHGGVPKKGWKETQRILDKADALLPLFREKRWRNILIVPFKAGDMEGGIVLIDYDADKLGQVDDYLFRSVNEVIASVLPTLMQRELDSSRIKDELEHLKLSRPRSVESPTEGKREEAPEVGKETGEPETGPEAAAEVARNLIEVAREAKRTERTPDHLTLWKEEASHRPVPSSKGIDVSALVWELKEYYSRRGHKGEIFLELEEDLPKLHTDKKLLRDSLMHLLENAMRFSPSGAPVILGVERWGDEVLLRVEDQGPGIAGEIIEDVMRAEIEDKSKGRPKEKSQQERPLGLVITRKYVVAMGGDFSIKTRPDEGTTTFIRLRVLPFIGEGL
ncbi:MAG: hypothetical protein A2W01_10615 [Candidatus Solincola sediminis]|uniref:Histidine kinase n=1 Tax=Candidatus Solincola sediminis TaxID=1797199 RepID=A0A1F2WMD9_9ACTN|nr:MAG: hypothetical protein A2Y75_12440 [Candidatus Solincola sediminis]OFW61357.1 MAG: hypothetical protein A2W01_10615 [Candidatus Solincola sediminis]